MVNVDLTAAERGILLEMLESVRSDLGMEIADTDRQDFRERLKEQRRILEKLMSSLQGGAPPR